MVILTMRIRKLIHKLKNEKKKFNNFEVKLISVNDFREKLQE